LALLFAATRLPGLSAGFGADGDYWHVAAVARRWVAGGGYRVARAPGNPLHEAQTAAALWLGQRLPWGAESLPAGLLTLLWSALLLLLYLHLARRIGVPRRRLGAALLLLLFWPIFWAHGVDGSDHVPAALLALGALALALAPESWPRPTWWPLRPLLAGVALGLAAGYRLGSLALAPACGLALVLPLGGRAVGGDRRRRLLSLLLCAAAAAVTTTALFTPVWAQLGWQGMRPAVRHHTLLGLLLRGGVRGAQALAPGLVLPLLLWLLLRRRYPVPRNRWRSRWLGLFALPRTAPARARWVLRGAIGGSLLAFLPLPLDPAYLLPAAICTLLLLARRLSTRRLYLLASAALLAALLEPACGYDRFRWPALHCHLQPGPAVRSLLEGRRIRDYPQRLTAIDFAPGTLVIVGRALEGEGGEEFHAVAAEAWRRHPRHTGVGFAGYRILLRPGDTAATLRAAGFVRIAIDRQALARAAREAGIDLRAQARETGMLYGVFTLADG
jgi:hypothetical protein